jgi:hypothetical protein
MCFYIRNFRPNNTANDNDSNIRELEQLVDQLQTVNRTLSSMYTKMGHEQIYLTIN